MPDPRGSQSETSLPGLRAFSRRTVNAIEALDTALTQENVTEAANACHWLMDELDDVRDALIGLMAKAGDEQPKRKEKMMVMDLKVAQDLTLRATENPLSLDEQDRAQLPFALATVLVRNGMLGMSLSQVTLNVVTTDGSADV